MCNRAGNGHAVMGVFSRPGGGDWLTERGNGVARDGVAASGGEISVALASRREHDQNGDDGQRKLQDAESVTDRGYGG